jgi:hypothetical protein
MHSRSSCADRRNDCASRCSRAVIDRVRCAGHISPSPTGPSARWECPPCWIGWRARRRGARDERLRWMLPATSATRFAGRSRELCARMQKMPPAPRTPPQTLSRRAKKRPSSRPRSPMAHVVHADRFACRTLAPNTKRIAANVAAAANRSRACLRAEALAKACSTRVPIRATANQNAQSWAFSSSEDARRDERHQHGHTAERHHQRCNR